MFMLRELFERQQRFVTLNAPHLFQPPLPQKPCKGQRRLLLLYYLDWIHFLLFANIFFSMFVYVFSREIMLSCLYLEDSYYYVHFLSLNQT